MKNLFFIISLILFSSCTNDNITPAKPVVYVAGSEFPLSGWPIAVYWKDGVRVPLSDSVTTSAVATSIFVSGNDVYVAGYLQKPDEHPVNPNYLAVYWKNGVAHPLTDRTRDAKAYSITIDGNDVYVAGYEVHNHYAAKYWKNGVPVILSDTTWLNSVAKSIAINSGNVYVGGQDGGLPTYWKNRTANHTNSFLELNAPVSMGIFQGDIYLAYKATFGGYINYFAKYSKNGIESSLPTGMDANGMAVSSRGDVYVAGSKWTVVGTVAKYWKNGKSVELTDSTVMSTATAIAVFQNDVYVAGTKVGGVYASQNAVYWKNGIEVPLTTKIKESHANAIFVK